jgi:hypothetical protein
VFSAKNAAQRSAEVGREWLETILSRFGPATDRAQNITTLDFEKPLLELDKRIKEVGPASKYRLGKRYVACDAHRRRTHALIPQVRKVAEENGVDVSSQIGELESRAQQVRFVWAPVRDCCMADAASPAFPHWYLGTRADAWHCCHASIGREQAAWPQWPHQAISQLCALLQHMHLSMQLTTAQKMLHGGLCW